MMALASDSVNAQDFRRVCLTAVPGKNKPVSSHFNPLPTPPSSISPQLLPHKAKPSLGHPVLAMLPESVHFGPGPDSDSEESTYVSPRRDVRKTLRRQSMMCLPGLTQPTPDPDSDSDVSMIMPAPGRDVQGRDAHGRAITSEMLARDHLPRILVSSGPLVLRHIIQQLSKELPGLKAMHRAKVRRLVVGAMEPPKKGQGLAIGGKYGEVVFEKVGWGRWRAYRRDEAVAEESPDVCIDSVETESFAGGNFNEDIGHGFQGATSSVVPATKSTTISGPDDAYDDESTDSEDWEEIGADALLKRALPDGAPDLLTLVCMKCYTVHKAAATDKEPVGCLPEKVAKAREDDNHHHQNDDKLFPAERWSTPQSSDSQKSVDPDIGDLFSERPADSRTALSLSSEEMPGTAEIPHDCRNTTARPLFSSMTNITTTQDEVTALQILAAKLSR